MAKCLRSYLYHIQVPKEEVAVKPVGGTKMQQVILQKTLSKHREGIIVKQVAAGKEFKGQPFYSKPDIIHFKVLHLLFSLHIYITLERFST